jgi:hypothetical protein
MATVAPRGERARRGGQANPKTSAGAASPPSDEKIRLLAYRLYQRRCEAGIAGDAAADWIQAENQLANGETAASAND